MSMVLSRLSADGVATEVAGPYLDDLAVGDVLDDAPGLTITTGHAALHGAILGSRLRLALDRHLSRAVSGAGWPFVHPHLVADVAIGQSTGLSQRVVGNLFYRGLAFTTPVHAGDTISTRTTVVGRREAQRRDGQARAGLVALRSDVHTAAGEHVLGFWRCPLLPIRPGAGPIELEGVVDDIPTDLDLDEALTERSAWKLSAFGRSGPALEPGAKYRELSRQPVRDAVLLTRMTLNLAAAHVDPDLGSDGRPLVYGGHVIGLAGSAVERLLPSIVTPLGWRWCSHTGPTFEGDLLNTVVTIVDVTDMAHGTVAEVQVDVGADNGRGERRPVLDWRLVGLFA